MWSLSWECNVLTRTKSTKPILRYGVLFPSQWATCWPCTTWYPNSKSWNIVEAPRTSLWKCDQADYASYLCCSWVMMLLNCQGSMDDQIPCFWLLVIQQVAKGGWKRTAARKNLRIRWSHLNMIYKSNICHNLLFVDIPVILRMTLQLGNYGNKHGTRWSSCRRLFPK